MKRVKAGCVLQTLVFMQKEDCGFSREFQLRYNREEFEKYKATLERKRTKYKIVEQTVQPDDSIIVKIINQSNMNPVGNYPD